MLVQTPGGQTQGLKVHDQQQKVLSLYGATGDDALVALCFIHFLRCRYTNTVMS